jgi:tRNA(Ile)-lysidine synthase
MPDRLEETVVEFIHRHGLFAGAGRILLAVSGGADSMALLHILAALKARGSLEAELVCAHINHHLRGPASDADERFVVEQAGRLGLPVVTRSVEVRAYARKHGLSLETAGRQLRLAGLGEMARDRGCAWAGTGHQKNDNAETVLHRLWRGTGFRGLAGIRPARRIADLWFASPLLCAPRAEIVMYLAGRHLPWREDQTNADIAHTRNYIRHRLLPLLEQEADGQGSMGVPPTSTTGVASVNTGPGRPGGSWAGCPCDLVEELSELAASAARLSARIEGEAEAAWPRLVASGADGVVIAAPGLAALPELVAVDLIRRAVTDLDAGGGGLAEPHYRGILKLARRKVGRKEISLPGGWIARYERGHVMLRKDRKGVVGRVLPSAGAGGEMVRDAHPTGETVRGTHPAGAPAYGRSAGAPDGTSIVLAAPGKTRFAGHEIEARILGRSEMDWGRLKGDKSPALEYLDFDQVKPPLIVRPRRPGDRFQPLGWADEKKVGKFLTTAKMSHDLREHILILADREKIIWVYPVRLSEQVKITDRTQRILQLTIGRRFEQ